jgi:hypothetical protein
MTISSCDITPPVFPSSYLIHYKGTEGTEGVSPFCLLVSPADKKNLSMGWPPGDLSGQCGLPLERAQVFLSLVFAPLFRCAPDGLLRTALLFANCFAAQEGIFSLGGISRPMKK